jgi:hypothetical protein
MLTSTMLLSHQRYLFNLRYSIELNHLIISEKLPCKFRELMCVHIRRMDADTRSRHIHFVVYKNFKDVQMLLDLPQSIRVGVDWGEI